MGSRCRSIGFLLAVTIVIATAAPSAVATPGDVDPTFGSGGMASLPASTYGSAGGLTALPDDRILVTGEETGCYETGSSVVSRLEADGTLDRTFGTNGHARVGVDIGFMASPLVQRDGKIVLFGCARTPAGPNRAAMAAARLEPDGSVDQSFGDHGRVIVPVDAAWSVAGDAVETDDGGLVLSGLLQWKLGGEGTAVVARLSENGAPDTTFGSGGTYFFDAPPELLGGSLATLPDGNIIVGTAAYYPEHEDWTLARLTRRGRLDSSYGNGGFAVAHSNWPAEVNAILAQPDESVVVAGSLGPLKDEAESTTIGKFSPTGHLDGLFDDGGLVFEQIGGEGPRAAWTDLARQPDGKLITAGYYDFSSGDPQSSWVVARYRADGSRDASFGSHGLVMRGPRDDYLFAVRMALQPRGRKIVIGGPTSCVSDRRAALIRFDAADGPPEPDPGPAMLPCDSSLDMDADGQIPMPVSCPAVESGCSGSVTLYLAPAVTNARKRKPRLGARIGWARFRLVGGASKTLTVRAKGKARSKLVEEGRARVVAVFNARDAEGHRRVTRRKLTVRRAR